MPAKTCAEGRQCIDKTATRAGQSEAALPMAGSGRVKMAKLHAMDFRTSTSKDDQSATGIGWLSPAPLWVWLAGCDPDDGQRASGLSAFHAGWRRGEARHIAR